MKKSIKIFKTIATVGIITIMLVCSFRLGNVTAKRDVDAKNITPLNTIPLHYVHNKEYPQQRVMTGNYYDYMVIKTVDGNEWLLDDTKGSPYIQNGTSVFHDGALVQVIFDTMGTETLTDDIIVDVRNIDKRYK